MRLTMSAKPDSTESCAEDSSVLDGEPRLWLNWETMTTDTETVMTMTRPVTTCCIWWARAASPRCEKSIDARLASMSAVIAPMMSPFWAFHMAFERVFESIPASSADMSSPFRRLPNHALIVARSAMECITVLCNVLYC